MIKKSLHITISGIQTEERNAYFRCYFVVSLLQQLIQNIFVIVYIAVYISVFCCDVVTVCMNIRTLI